MSQQHPANAPTNVADLTEHPAPAPDALVDELRSALELAEWTPEDHLTIGANGLNVECSCNCGTVTAVTGHVVQHSSDIAELMVKATNSLPTLLDRLTTAETELAQYARDIEPVDELRGRLQIVREHRDRMRRRLEADRDRLRAEADCHRARGEDLRAALDESESERGRLTSDREQAAELITGLTDLVRQVAGELGVPAYADRQIMPTLRRALHDSVAAQARAERLQRQLADVGALASGWVEHAAGDRTALLGADTLIQAVRDLAAAEVK